MLTGVGGAVASKRVKVMAARSICASARIHQRQLTNEPEPETEAKNWRNVIPGGGSRFLYGDRTDVVRMDQNMLPGLDAPPPRLPGDFHTLLYEVALMNPT